MLLKMISKRKKYKHKQSLLLYLERKDERSLRSAASKNDTERLTRLLESGVNPNASDENGRTALHLASVGGYSTAVKILLSYKADCNAVDNLGNTPLHLAVCSPSEATTNLLLNAGSSAFHKGRNGCTPFQLAQTKLSLLQKHCIPENGELKAKLTEVIEKMKVLSSNEAQEKKLAELFASGLLLNENSDLASDLNNLYHALNNLEL